MQRPITRGASANTGLIFHVFAQDSTSTSGAGKASVAYSSWTCYYIRSGEAISGAITPQDITTIGTYAAPSANTNIRIKAVDNTNMIGIYEVQIHSDWVNTTNSCQSLTIYLTASGVAVLPIQIPLIAVNQQDSVRAGLTALPNAAADAAGGLPISDAGGLDLDAQIGTKINDILTDTGTTLDGRIPAALVGGRMDANVGAISSDATAADNAEAFFDGTGYAGTNNVIPLVTTTTNLTNAATNGDLTATMKASVNTEADTALSDYGALKPTTAGRTLDVSATGEAGVDWANVGSPTTAVDLSGTTIATSQVVASVSGAVGSVTGNVGGNVTGSVGSLATQAKADVNTEVDSALVDIHLDHLLAADYDPASKPGVSTALLNELVENDGGVSRYTANALEQAPSGSAGAVVLGPEYA